LVLRFFEFWKRLNSRVKVTLAAIGVQNWGQQLTLQYNQLYAIDLGATAVQLGFLNSITAAISAGVSIPVGWATEKYSAKRMLLLGLLFALVSSIIFSTAGSWWWLIPAFVVGSQLVRIGPLTDIIFFSSTDPSQRASLMGFSRVVWGVFNIFAPIFATFVVANFGGINARGIRPLYFLQVGLTIFALSFLWKFLEAREGSNRVEAFSFKKAGLVKSYRDFFEGEKWLQRFMILRIIMQFGINLAMPFVPLWMVSYNGADEYFLGVMGTVSVITALILQIPAGRLSDRLGRKKTYFILRPFCYLGTFLMVFTRTPEYLIIVGVLGAIAMAGAGGIGGVGFTPFITMFWEMVPHEKRGRWFGVEGVMGVATIPAAVLGGILWDRGFAMIVMLAPVVLEVLLVLPILSTIPETFKID
jgi:MFS family permease